MMYIAKDKDGNVLEQFDDFGKADSYCVGNGCELYEKTTFGDEFVADYDGCFCEKPAPFFGENIRSLTDDLIESERI